MSSAIDILQNPATIRQRAHKILGLARKGQLQHFAFNEAKLDDTAGLVAQDILQRYPSLEIPYHGRWRHFAPDGDNRWQNLRQTLGENTAMVRSAIDLAFVSVLLDAGAGPSWHYRELDSGKIFSRSEGLAIASIDMFKAGIFSSDKNQPWQVDARALAALTPDILAQGMQASAQNPLLGLNGRVALLQALAEALAAAPDIFIGGRPGAMFDALTATSKTVPAPAILALLLKYFSRIWPGRIVLQGISLGDVWRHSAITTHDETNGLMPFHKLSQWLTYSLLEPLEWAGMTVTDLDQLTGLAEYRNGGLFIDSAVLSLKQPEQAHIAHAPSSEIVVEWRALTIALLDELRPIVAHKLGLAPQDFPLARMLEGGTWHTGRKLAQAKRGGTPPLNIDSDGTVF